MRILIGSLVAILCAIAFYFILITVLPEDEETGFQRGSDQTVPLDRFDGAAPRRYAGGDFATPSVPWPS